MTYSLIVLTKSSHWEKLCTIPFDNSVSLKIVSLVPGVPNDQATLRYLKNKYECSAEYTSFEELAQICGHKDVSQLTAEIVKKSLDKRLYQSNGMDELFYVYGEVLSNMVALNLQPVVSGLTCLDYLISREKPSKVILFGNVKNKFSIPERLDVGFLYNNEATFIPVILRLLKLKECVAKVVRTNSDMIVSLKHQIRHYLIFYYKLIITLLRVAVDSKSSSHVINKNNSVDIAVIVRAESEYWTVKPLLQYIEKNEQYSCLVIQDDLIKNPSSKQTLKKDGRRYLSVHSQRKFIDAFLSFVRSQRKVSCFKKYFLLSRKIINQEMNDVGSVLLHSDLIPQYFLPAFYSLPELENFSDEIKYLHKKYRFKACITMDMVDQWCAIIGHIGNDLNFKSYIIQNAVMGDMIHPKPISTDYMFVAGEEVKKMLSQSCNVEDKVFSTGLPMYDWMFNQFESTKSSRSVNRDKKVVTIATQPLVGDYEYNYELIESVLFACKDLQNVQVVVKIHPREKVSQYEHYLERLQNTHNRSILLYNNKNILEQISESDVLVARCSTSLQSSILMGTFSVAYLNNLPSDEMERIDYLRSGATIKVYDRDGLRSIMHKLLSEDNSSLIEKIRSERKKYIDSYISEFNGKSSERILQVVSTTM